MAPARKRSKQKGVERRSSSEDEGDDIDFISMETRKDSDEDIDWDAEEEIDEERLMDSDMDNGAEIHEEKDEDEDEDEEEEEEEDEGEDNEAEPSKAEMDEEMNELEKQYHHLRIEQNLLRNLKHQKNEDAIKGQAVKNQKALWDKTLELRFLLQKTFLSSNKLPKEPVRTSFCQINSAVDQAYSDLIASSKQTLNSMLELEETLLEKNALILQGANGNNKDSHQCDSSLSLLSHLKEEDDEEWLQIHRMNCRIAPFRNDSIDKWQRKTQVTTGAAAFRGNLHAFNQNISEQVANYMRDPSRMINRMQLRRSSVGVFGKVDTLMRNEDGDPELLDDTEFYSQLLKEFIESCSLTSETTAHALRKLQPKKRKAVDRRASKSRKIRYNVHEKIVNFMVPVPKDIPSVDPKLFENLFGTRNNKSASVK